MNRKSIAKMNNLSRSHKSSESFLSSIKDRICGFWEKDIQAVSLVDGLGKIYPFSEDDDSKKAFAYLSILSRYSTGCAGQNS